MTISDWASGLFMFEVAVITLCRTLYFPAIFIFMTVRLLLPMSRAALDISSPSINIPRASWCFSPGEKAAALTGILLLPPLAYMLAIVVPIERENASDKSFFGEHSVLHASQSCHPDCVLPGERLDVKPAQVHSVLHITVQSQSRSCH